MRKFAFLAIAAIAFTTSCSKKYETSLVTETHENMAKADTGTIPAANYAKAAPAANITGAFYTIGYGGAMGNTITMVATVNNNYSGTKARAILLTQTGQTPLMTTAWVTHVEVGTGVNVQLPSITLSPVLNLPQGPYRVKLEVAVGSVVNSYTINISM